MWILITMAVLVGLVVGSFLNVCIHRWPRELSVIRPRSACPSCGKPIAWHDNIPVVSYVLLKGRCRNCGWAIPVRYPIVEVATALVFALSVWKLGASLAAVKWALFGALTVALFFSDLEERILPDQLTIGGALAGLLLAPRVPMDYGYVALLAGSRLGPTWVSVVEALVGGSVAALLLWFVGQFYYAIRKREGVGLGDVKMMAMIGTFLGLAGTLQTLILGSILGSLIGLAYIKATGKDWRTYELPFGSFLALAALWVGLWQGPLARG